MWIRAETAGDAAAIGALTTAAFATAPHSGGNEARIVDGLRAAGALTVSLLAEDQGEIVGHAAFSPVTIGGKDGGWFGLGPVSVRPDKQRAGIGAALIRAGLERLREAGAQGCVVLGDPAYYGRFGFTADPAITYPGVPAEYFQAIGFGDDRPRGVVSYHPAFGSA